MPRLFGTDGIRGKVNLDLTNSIAYKLGQAAVLFKGKRVAVARDTRISGTMLECALSSGVMSVGGEVYLCGVIPTPAVPMLVRKHNMDAGIMISASHNPPCDNGLKMFDSNGLKLPDEVEDEIDAFITKENNKIGDYLAQGDCVGTVFELETAQRDYVDFVVNSVKEKCVSFQELKIALDVAHGASCKTSEAVLKELGAQVITINSQYNGTDINVECGSTHLKPLKELVVKTGADIGIAHDGDADRVMMVTNETEEIDGDIILSVIAKAMKKCGTLKNNAVVATVMSNLGLKCSLESENINLVQTKVGDRYVLEEMLRGGYVCGGEQSGHVILSDFNTTGDGLMTAVQFLVSLKTLEMTPSSAVSSFRRFPQVLINVKVSDKKASINKKEVQSVIQQANESLNSTGRVLIRESGTEPIVRVMVEAKTEEEASLWANRIAEKL